MPYTDDLPLPDDSVNIFTGELRPGMTRRIGSGEFDEQIHVLDRIGLSWRNLRDDGYVVDFENCHVGCGEYAVGRFAHSYKSSVRMQVVCNSNDLRSLEESLNFRDYLVQKKAKFVDFDGWSKVKGRLCGVIKKI